MSAPPEISVLVCTRNRAKALARCLAAISFQRSSFAFETLVVDNGSADDTRACVDAARRTDPSIRYLFEAEPGLSLARNRGAGAAAAPILISLDDDAEPAQNWLEAFHAAARESDAAAIGGPILARFETQAPVWLAGQLRVLSAQDYGAERRTIDSPPYLFGGNLAIRRADLERIGGFDERFGRKGGALLQGEDIDLCERLLAAGRPLLYEPGAIVYHWISPERFEPSYLRKRAFDTGRTLGLHMQKRLSRGALVGELLKKSLKLPLHAAVWAGASLVGERETVTARERSLFVTLGLLRHLVRVRSRRGAV